jgi:hypothetical protein
MKRLMLGAAAAVAVLLYSGVLMAGVLGAGGFLGCPTSACSPCGDFVAARCGTPTGCGIQQDVVWETEQYNCMKTVYDYCTETRPISCVKNVYETCYRDECYTVCQPVYQTCYRTECYTVCKPVYQTCYRDVTCRIRKPVYQTC